MFHRYRSQSSRTHRCLRAFAVCVTLGWLSLGGMGCGSEAPELAELPFGDCACQKSDPPRCPVDVCDLRLEIESASCLGEVNLVEIQIGASLEKHIWLPGQPARTCATVKRGQSFSVVARSDTSWRWSPTIACPKDVEAGATEGTTVSRLLQCIPADEK